MYFHTRKPTNVIEEAKKMLSFCTTRPKPAYGRQGLDWIVRPGYSFGVFSTSPTDLIWCKNVTSLTEGDLDLLDV